MADVARNRAKDISFLLDRILPGHHPAWKWSRLDGWKRWLTVIGATHLTFTDLPALAQQAGLPTPPGTVPGLRGSDLTRSYVGTFFDQQLRGIPQPLLNGSAPGNPEVTFQTP